MELPGCYENFPGGTGHGGPSLVDGEGKSFPNGLELPDG